jgi:hypothetical protein
MLPSNARPLARLVLLSLSLTFVTARVVTILVMAHHMPNIYLHVRGTHVHHLNYGIFLLAGVGAYLLFTPGGGPAAPTVAVIYGIGLGLTFDEFGMWLHLSGDYWQRASFDAVIVLAAALGLAGFAPPLARWRPRQWVAAFVVLLLLAGSIRLAARAEPRFERWDRSSDPTAPTSAPAAPAAPAAPR